MPPPPHQVQRRQFGEPIGDKDRNVALAVEIEIGGESPGQRRR
jgi:hypothetical protein